MLNKKAAFTFMLQNETKEDEKLRQEQCYLSNQCLAETRRIGADNGKQLIDHFIQMSQTQCSYINQTHVMWADFLSHFQENFLEDAADFMDGIIANIEQAKEVDEPDGSSGATRIENEEEDAKSDKRVDPPEVEDDEEEYEDEDDEEKEDNILGEVKD